MMEPKVFLESFSRVIEEMTGKLVRASNTQRIVERVGPGDCESKIVFKGQSLANLKGNGNQTFVCDMDFRGPRADIFTRVMQKLVFKSHAESVEGRDVKVSLRNEATGEDSDRRLSFGVPYEMSDTFLANLTAANQWIHNNEPAVMEMFDIGIIAQNDINIGVTLPDDSAHPPKPVGTKFGFFLSENSIPGQYDLLVSMKTNNPLLIAALGSHPDVRIETADGWDRNHIVYEKGVSVVSQSALGTRHIIDAIKTLHSHSIGANM